MNRPIRRVALFAALMVFALLANLSFQALGRTTALLDDPNNRRVRDSQFAQPRGAILVGSTPIADSVPAKGAYAYQRVYPNGPLYAPATGFYSYIYGRTGLEQSYNQELAGTSASQFLTRLMDTFSGRQPEGASVVTTLNAKAQKAAWDAMGNQVGAVVAINWHTGAVLAYVSKPSFDPGPLSGNDMSAEQQAWRTLTTGVTPLTNTMTNRAAREVYPPGSTFKLVTAAAALQAGMTPSSTVASPARLKLPQTSTYLTNEGSCGGTRITLTQALRVSCNTAFANVGLQVGADALRTQAEKFGFDTSLGMNGISSVSSRFPASTNQAQLAQSAIGQFDVAATPLQMAVVSAAIANGGQVMQPYLVQQVRSPDLKVLSTTTPQPLQQAVSSQTATGLQQMMVDVVRNGTGTRAQVSGVTVGGKTGTAQSDPSRPPYAWFTGWARNPDVAVAVFVQSAAVARNDIAGGRLAGPVFAAVVEALR